MQAFTFKYQNTKGGGYFLLGILGVPFIVLFSSVLLLDYISWIFWISIPAMIALMVYCIILFAKKSKGKDTIRMDNNGFTSDNYGRILYSDIHSIPPYGPLQAPPPSMRIKLHNGKKLVWYLDANNAKLREDVNTFIAFRDALLLQLKRQISECPTPDATEKPTNVIEATRHTDVIQQLEDHKKRDYKYIAIPVSLIFAGLLFFRTCGEDLIRTHREKEFNHVRQGILRTETDYEEHLEKSRNVLDAYTKRFGAVSLLTNDPQAEVRFLPDIPKDPHTPKIDVIGLRRVEDNKTLQKVINHPDSFTYQLVAFNNEKGFLIGLNRSLFSEADSASSTVYFAVYNPHESLPSKFRSKSDTTFYPINYSTSISVPKSGEIAKTHFKNMDYASIRSILHRYESTYFYMAAKEEDGVSPERFEKVVSIVLDDLHEYDISTDQFVYKRFNAE